MKKSVLIVSFLLVIAPVFVFGQLITTGTTGSLNAPSARMQRDGCVMLGGNYLNRVITPSVFHYDTFNYFLNATFLPFLEVAYTCTLFKGTDVNAPNSNRFTNQDRSVSARFRLFKEGKYRPAIVVGGNDIFSSVSNKLSVTRNQYFSRFYLAFSKDFKLKKETIGVDLSLIYYRNRKNDGSFYSLALTYTPSFARNLNLVAEYDSRFYNVGVRYLLFDHLSAQMLLQDGKYISGGLAYKIYLK